METNLKLGVMQNQIEFGFKLAQTSHQCLWHVLPPKPSKSSIIALPFISFNLWLCQCPPHDQTTRPKNILSPSVVINNYCTNHRCIANSSLNTTGWTYLASKKITSHITSHICVYMFVYKERERVGKDLFWYLLILVGTPYEVLIERNSCLSPRKWGT
jgi:hypothetical protein